MEAGFSPYGSLGYGESGTYGASGKSGEESLKAGVHVEIGHWLLQGEVRVHEAAALEPLKSLNVGESKGWLVLVHLFNVFWKSQASC